MRLSDIISMAGDYLLFGGMIAFIALALFCVGYFLVYKRLMKGKKRLEGKRVLWAAAFGCYLFVVLSATLLDRGGFWVAGRVIPLFYSYREAWRGFNDILWRNLSLNILMFVPFGFLLPLGLKGFRGFWKTYLAGFLFSALIELAQLTFRRGVVEMDDIFNNLLGTMAGYGCYAAVRALSGRIRREEVRVGQVLLLQLPLVGTLMGFGLVFFVYAAQDLGNLQEECIAAYDGGLLRFSTDEVYSEETGLLPVYRIGRKTKEEIEAQAESFLAGIGAELDRGRTDAYENTVFCYSADGKHWLQIKYAGGTYSYSDISFRDWAKEEYHTEAARVEDAAADEVRAALMDYGIGLWEAASFQNEGDGRYSFQLEQYREDGIFYDGVLSCTYYDNGRMAEIDNGILTAVPYRNFQVISEKEAYDRLCAGEFPNGIFASGTILEGKIGAVRISYRIDTKGFYQPVYEFDALINGSDYSLVIPAVRDKNGGEPLEP